jgi:oligopeptide/dipeptide ABC transporter ATP-binding protein
MPEDLLTVENLSTWLFTRRGVVKAVDGVSFFLRHGETLGLVGESGCGKSMTCLSLLRLVPYPGRIVTGAISFEGADLLEYSEAEMRKIRGKKMSIVLQDPMSSLNPAFSIGEQVAEVLRSGLKLRSSALWRTVIDALKLVRIPSAEMRLGDYPHQLSGGMRQRVTGAIALSCRPSLLLADEPTTSLDVTIQAQYLSLLKQVQSELNTAMIFVTHDLGIVASVCDRVAVMYAGKIVETGPVGDLFRHPKHPYTCKLLSCVPRLDVVSERLASIDGQPPELVNLPPGCPFYPRCDDRQEICSRESPPETGTRGGHAVSCWKWPS